MTIADKKKKLLEERYLDMNRLSDTQLRVIRKLITPSTRLAIPYVSKRTIEANLQGRRKDGKILLPAILLAREELAACNEAMAEIDNLLNISPGL